MSDYFGQLVSELTTRSSRAVLSHLSPVSDPLRRFLAGALSRPAGEPGSLLADPVVEANFGWMTVPETMQDLSGLLLHPRLVESMDRVPKEFEKEYRFPATQHPYLHQVDSWKALQEPGRSVVVCSGTSSGKTECFLVPILDALARESGGRERISGVRALFLYPLNALIASQRDRLTAWTDGFDGKIRYCLYNGETPEEPPKNQAGTKVQVLSRSLLRADPPPILVTNGTMLEYMLVRKEDEPIISASKGKLKWIVLDEAHTYLGTSAADISLLLRRVLHAFDVSASDVHFIATSATLSAVGGPDGRAELQRFLADLAGISPDRVSVFEGSRSVSPLPPAPEVLDPNLPALAMLRGLKEVERFDVLAGNARFRDVRRLLTSKGPQSLRTLTSVLMRIPAERVSAEDAREALEYLDVARTGKRDEDFLLPIRLHLFQRTSRGLWCCSSQSCSGRRGGPLDSDAWRWGKVFLERRIHCDADGCEALVFELVLCSECGAEYLAASEVCRDGRRYLDASPTGGGDEQEGELDEPLLELEDEEAEEEGSETSAHVFAMPRLLAGTCPVGSDPAKWNSGTGEIDPDDQGTSLSVIGPDPGDGRRFRCARCSTRELKPGELFRAARSGAPFLLGVSIPTLLELSPVLDDEDGEPRPMGGRRILTFSDSRQGTARFALKAQLDAERNYIRSLIYHQVVSSRQLVDAERIADLEGQIAGIERADESTRKLLRTVLEEKRRDLRAAKNPPEPQVSWMELERHIMETREARSWMRSAWRHLPLGNIADGEVGNFLLAREFLRRPKRQFSLETLGLIALRYPAFDKLSEQGLPAAWRARERTLADWRTFLTIVVNFFLRARGIVEVDRVHLRWMGSPASPRVAIRPDGTQTDRYSQVRWPSLKPGGRMTQLPAILVRALGLAPGSQEDCAVVNELLQAAWKDLVRCGVLTGGQEGYRADLRRQAVLTPVLDSYHCPVTRRVLDTTLDRVSPYQKDTPAGDLWQSTPVRFPLHPYPFMRSPLGDDVPYKAVRDWLEECPEVRDLRERGVWTEFTDRVFLFQDYFRAAEHSAQMDSSRLRTLEEQFKKGRVNLLSCSTTMEMGVDIGGLSAVGMTNVPPSPANFLQRAGRAGRRKETASTTLTVCPGVPHSESVFLNPLWPFTTAVRTPYVSLDSERIVKRHVNALALREFLWGLSANVVKLESAWFFDDHAEFSSSPADSFALWLERAAESGAERLREGVDRVIERTTLAGVKAVRCLESTASHVRAVQASFRAEEVALREQLESARIGGGPEAAARSAVEKQLARLREEFLLKDLTARGFLPGHGFPTNIVPFVNSTSESIKAQTTQAREREDVRARWKGFPTRDVTLALREYAPGAEVVVDGQVFESAGVSLIWKAPPDDQSAREIQSFRVAWSCRSCGAAGVGSCFLQECPDCGAAGRERFLMREFLEPSGFAVDFGYETHNDISHRRYVPVRDPWISASGADWIPLPDPSVGRFRYSPEGLVFAHSLGENGHGYAICLRCGRASSETEERSVTAPIPRALDDVEAGGGHRRLRGGRSSNGSPHCSAAGASWMIKRNQALGVPNRTDVFELQLLSPQTLQGMRDPKIAQSIAIALGRALAEDLGIDDRELGCARLRTRDATGMDVYSAIIFDLSPGGAGFVGSLPTSIGRIVRQARRILECPRQCDRACQACLLTYASQHQLGLVDRHKALEFLTEELITRLDLPSEHRAFGAESAFEHQTALMAIQREISRGDARQLNVFLCGPPEDWDLGSWNLRPRLLAWAAGGVRIVISAPEDILRALPSEVGGVLASLIEATGAQLLASPGREPAGEPSSLIAELMRANGTFRWATEDRTARVPGEQWGVQTDGTVVVRSLGSAPAPAVPGRKVRLDALRGRSGTHQELVVRNQLDGPISEFGTRFWATVTAALPSLAAKLAGGRLAKVWYSDRYIQTPLSARLAIEVVRALAAQPAWSKEESSLKMISTTMSSQVGAPPTLFTHDWRHSMERKRVVETAIGSIVPKASFELRERKALEHYRELTLEWADGISWHVRLDQGFGFMGMPQPVRFPFERSVTEQSNALLAGSGQIRASSATVFYLKKV